MMKNMKSPLDVLREANRRKEHAVIETPLDLLRSLNREKEKREATERILKHLRHNIR